MKNIWDKIIKGTAEFFKDAGFKKAVIGLSGGIDSSVVAVIAQQALGYENVTGVTMPSPYSSQGSVDDSEILAQNLLIRLHGMSISKIMDSFNVVLEKLFYGFPVDSTEQNIQARIRAVLLMAICNKYHALLLNTCNKSEEYTGYCTLYGDSCGAVAPIGDLYKTDVYKLAKWINEQPDLPDIPEVIINKAPSAELSHGQKDEDDLPSYDVLDPILGKYVDAKWREEDFILMGYDKDIVEKVVELIKSSEFKRKQSPPVIKV